MSQYRLTEEGKKYLKTGLPEKQLIEFLSKSGETEIDIARKELGETFNIALQWCKRFNVVEIKNGRISLTSNKIPDEIHNLEKSLNEVQDEKEPVSSDAQTLVRRNLIEEEKETLERKAEKIVGSEITYLLPEVIASDMWKKKPFRKYNVTVSGPKMDIGKRQPYSRFLSEVKRKLIEMGFIESHDDVLKMTENLLYNVLTKIYGEHVEELKSLNAPELVLKPSFPRYTLKQVHEMYAKATGINTVGEKDMRPEEEKWICDYSKKENGCEAVFVTEFPVEGMKFYHMINPQDTTTVLWADLLFRGLEIATCPMREHRYQNLVAQMKKAGLNPEHPGYKYYLQAFKFGLPPHGGFGFGIDRFLEKILGLGNVKEATLFPRDINRLTP